MRQTKRRPKAPAWCVPVSSNGCAATTATDCFRVNDEVAVREDDVAVEVVVMIGAWCSPDRRCPTCRRRGSRWSSCGRCSDLETHAQAVYSGTCACRSGEHRDDRAESAVGSGQVFSLARRPVPLVSVARASTRWRWCACRPSSASGASAQRGQKVGNGDCARMPMIATTISSAQSM